MKTKLIKILAVVSACFVAIACTKTDDECNCCPPSKEEPEVVIVPPVPVDDNGITQDIYNIVPLYVFNIYNDWGVTINTGNTPPNIEGTYFISPAKLKKSNFDDSYDIGYKFADYYFTFSNQDNQKLTVDVEYYTPSTGTTGKGKAFFIGHGNTFTIFGKIIQKDVHGHLSAMIDSYSGTITSEGIKDFHNLFVMVDNGGNPDGNLIENGQGRLIYDSDGISERRAKPSVTTTVRSTGDNLLKDWSRK